MKIGYDPDFIGADIPVALPRLTPEVSGAALHIVDAADAVQLDYPHYTVVMNATTKQPLFAALNIDQSKYRKTKSKGYWKADSRIGPDQQLSDDHYRLNEWDKGHMVMRWNTAWGDTPYEAQAADDESYYYTNAAFQHENFNRDEWKALEIKVVRDFSEDSSDKLCVFTGPIHNHLDRHHNRAWHDTVRIPSGFFKIVVYRPKPEAATAPVGVKAFAMFQDDELLKDRKGARNIKFAYYQVTVREIEEMTGLDFGEALFDANPMKYFDSATRRRQLNIKEFPERRLVTEESDIIDDVVRPYSMEHHEHRSVCIVAAMVAPKAPDTAGEWVSLLNVTTEKVNLKGWRLADETNASIELRGTLQPGGVLKLDAAMLGDIRLRNKGGALKLFDADPCLLDHVNWSAHDVRKTKNNHALLFSPG